MLAIDGGDDGVMVIPKSELRYINHGNLLVVGRDVKSSV